MYITVNGAQIFYNKLGTGQALILLHGNGEDSAIFDNLATKLSKHFTVYTIDSRNHGKSQKTDDYAYGTMANDIYAFILELKLYSPVVVGFSDGAIVALMLELMYPSTFSKMIWLGINLQPADFKDEYLQELKDAYARSQDPLLYLMLSEPNIPIENLKNINVPTLVVKAEDELFINQLYTNIVKVMPCAKLLEMKLHSHDSYVVNNDILYPYLMEFFQS